MLKTIKAFLEKRLSVLVLIFMVIQPAMDVLSYFLMERENTSLSTALRFVLLLGVALLGFLLTERKKLYFVFYGIAGVFWVLHVLNCFRIGYRSPVADAANYFRMLSFPIFTLSFITFFQRGGDIRRSFYLGAAVNLAEIIFFTALPWLTGHPVYTYGRLEVGVMGWFGTPNAQSAIVMLVSPLSILWASRTKKYPLFLLAIVLSFGLMYLTGTKLTFYSIFIIAGAYVFVFILNMGLRSLKYVLPLIAAMAIVFAFRGQSPMVRREIMSNYALGNYQKLVQDSLENGGADEDVIRQVQSGADLSASAGYEAKLERLRNSLMSIYTGRGVYGSLYADLHQRFGAYTVMDAYDYATDSFVLSDSRVRKTTFARLIWEEKDFLTRVLGFEYSDMIMGTEVYDLENDFPALFYFCGYLGFGLYLVYFGYLFFIILRAFFRDVAACVQERKGKKGNPFVKGFGSFWQGLKRFLTVEMGGVGMTFLLATIAAQVSGNVLRRPNVTVYFAVVAACVYHITVEMRKKEKPHDLSGGF